MRFDEDSRLDTSQVQDTRSGFPGGRVAIGGGAGVLGLVVFLLVNLLGGGGSTGALPGIEQVQSENTQLEQECKTGEDANTKQDCRVVAVVNSVQTFWAQEFERRGGRYQTAPTRLFSGATQTGCGAASSEVGRYLRRLHLFQAAGRCQPAVPVSPKPNRLAPASRFTGDCPAEAGAHTPIHGRFSGLRATPGDHKQRRIA
jgi:hypothetical protein